MIKETNKIIDLLGGTGALAKLLDVNLSAVSNYRKKGFKSFFSVIRYSRKINI